MRIRLTTTVSDETRRELDAITQRTGLPAGRVIDELVRIAVATRVTYPGIDPTADAEFVVRELRRLAK